MDFHFLNPFPVKKRNPFDFTKERFRCVEFPDEGLFLGLTRFNGSLALWLELEDWKTSETCCYLLRDGEEDGESWSRQSRQVSRYFQEIRGDVVASGKFPGSSSSNSDMMVMSYDLVSENQLLCVYSYSWGKSDHADKEDEVFFVGDLPDEVPYLNVEYPFHHWHSSSNIMSQDEVHCLLESNNLYLSLDHILDPASATVS